MRITLIAFLVLSILSCSDDNDTAISQDDTTPNVVTTTTYQEYITLDFDNLDTYTPINLPDHFDDVATATNTPANNPITNEGAALGRVLFYDENLSINNTVSCATCHDQTRGFDDPNRFSTGFEGGLTGAHAMRLLNAQYYLGENFFWDKRAETLEEQTTQPIQNEVEMGFDAAHGGFDAVITKLDALEYYPELFTIVYGDATITENRIQLALAQFIRAMVSSSSEFDDGFAQVYNVNAPGNGIGQNFPNYTDEENAGKVLFLNPPQQGGVGCAACHQPPTFALNQNSRSNGLDAGETIIFKAPSLKSAALSTHFMHDGRFASLSEVMDHYSTGVQAGPALDNRLEIPNTNNPLQLNLSDAEKNALEAFIITLSDFEIENDNRFSDPFID
ncbi:cytochrome c peroxidase [Dokdonia sp.]|uniref:cytochrome-c peroxidase n=1 Tax=Dokdonia sp. TaxID=2024995 RepID=UPI0032644F76